MSEDHLTHPTPEELRALSIGQLAGAELDRICAHLEDCPECCRSIDRPAAVDPLLARLQQSAARQGEALVNRVQRRSAVRAVRRWRAARTAAERGDQATEPVILPAPSQVGDYEILAEVGRGGMGVVYKARHRGLHRLVALKMVLAGEFASPAQEQRFRLEAELAARVQHPNIVQIHEIGSYQGHPFLAMEWVEGGSLANRLDGQSWRPGEAASLLETLARAIHVAHSEGVIHRDLKPANILLQTGGGGRKTDQGESSQTESTADHTSHLHPKITDFGLARPIEGGVTLTQSGLLVGTPGYMAPEQAGGSERRALVGPATDIYALGVVLYQLLTGQLPFQGDSTLEVLRAVTSDEPVRPRRLQPRLPRDLEAVTLRCLEKEPARRYPSALALAEDLQRFRAGKPVAARPVGQGARLARACRRRPVVALLLGLLTVSLFGGLAGVTWKWQEANAQRDLANAERSEALFHAYRARLSAAVAAVQNHDVTDAARHLDAAPKALRGWEWRHLRSRLDDSIAVIPISSSKTVLSPGQQGFRVLSIAEESVRLLDAQGHAERTVPFPHEKESVWVAAEALDGLVTLDRGRGTIARLRDPTGTVRGDVQVPADRSMDGVVFSPDRKRLAIAWRSAGRHPMGVYDFSGKEQALMTEAHRAEVWSLVFSPDGTRLASASDDGTARLWDAATGRPISGPLRHPGNSRVLSAAFRRDGARIVTAAGDGTVCQWDAWTGAAVEPPYERHAGDVWTAVYSPDGEWVASAGSDRSIRLWRATGRQDALVLHGHTGKVTQLAFTTDGRRLGSVSDDGTARIWEADTRAGLPVLRGHTTYVYPVAYSPDGQWIASGSWDGTARLWDARTGGGCAVLRHPGVVRTLAFSPDSSWLVSGGDGDDRLRLWDVATGMLQKVIEASGSRILSIAVSPDGTLIAAVDWNGDLSVWDVATGQQVARVRLGGFAQTKGLAFSPDGRLLASTTPEFQVYLWDVRTHRPTTPLTGHTGEVFCVTFSRDGSRLASASLDRTIRVWNVEKGDCQVILRGHTDDVFAAAFHPDGRRLASAGRDGAIWLWDLARGEEVARLPGHTSYVWSLAFSPDGATLASGSGDATVRLWDTASLSTRYQARQEAEALRPEADRLLERLWRQKDDPAAVVAALRADRGLSEPLRQAALRAVLRRAQPPGPAAGKPSEPPSPPG
jgi:WD40 repeat protein/tRNA A-37 threonylcarbamoyl transferase component Bud32